MRFPQSKRLAGALLVVLAFLSSGCSDETTTATPKTPSPSPFAAREAAPTRTPAITKPTPQLDLGPEAMGYEAGAGFISVIGIRLEAEPNNGGAPLTVAFRAEGEEDTPGITYLWDFGDGSPPKYGMVVEHTYWHPGEYTASVLAFGNGTEDSDDTTIIVEEEGFDFSIDAAPDVGAAPLTVHFVAVIDDEEIPGPLRFLWEFGDGSRDVSNPTSHTYRRPGEYTALLTVTNGVGQWAQRDVMIQVD
jgi:PKD repeat protein